jgi:hypothetical protein
MFFLSTVCHLKIDVTIALWPEQTAIGGNYLSVISITMKEVKSFDQRCFLVHPIAALVHTEHQPAATHNSKKGIYIF